MKVELSPWKIRKDFHGGNSTFMNSLDKPSSTNEAVPQFLYNRKWKSINQLEEDRE